MTQDNVIAVRTNGIDNNQEPATSRQLWALFVASKKAGEPHDYRGEGLTKARASELLKQFNEKTNYSVSNKESNKSNNIVIKKSESLKELFISYMKDKVLEYHKEVEKTLNIKSIVEVEASEFGNRKYAFFGYGCGFAGIEFDKRSRKGKDILDYSWEYRQDFITTVLDTFDKEQIDYCKKVGFPLNILLKQDIVLTRRYYEYVANFMRQQGVNRVYVWDRLD